MSKVAIIKIHPGLNMALPQLAGELSRGGHQTRLFFFKKYHIIENYLQSTYTRDNTIALHRDNEVFTDFEEEYYTLARELAQFKPDAIGLSVISMSIPESIKTTYFLRQHFNVPILWGGVGTTLQPEIAIEHADLVCIGEGEEVITEFADCLDHGADWSTIAGTWTRSADGAITKNPKRAIGSLDDIAIPDWRPANLRYIMDKRVVSHQCSSCSCIL